MNYVVLVPLCIETTKIFQNVFTMWYERILYRFDMKGWIYFAKKNSGIVQDKQTGCCKDEHIDNISILYYYQNYLSQSQGGFIETQCLDKHKAEYQFYTRMLRPHQTPQPALNITHTLAAAQMTATRTHWRACVLEKHME